MATGKSHGICNEMQGILSKHSYDCPGVLTMFLCQGTCIETPGSRQYCPFCKKLVQVIQNFIFAWDNLIGSVIRTERNTGKINK